MFGLYLLIPSALAAQPDLSYTESVVDDCFSYASAQNPSASISVQINSVTVVTSTANLDLVYGALANVGEADSVVITSNPSGNGALVAAQQCLDSRAPTVAMGRVYQARPDLRHDDHLFQKYGYNYSSFEVDPVNDVITLVRDGVSSPECEDTVHLFIYTLANGDYSVGYTYLDGNEEKKKETSFECENVSCMHEEGSSCTIITRQKGMKDCYCTGSGNSQGCAGAESEEEEETDFSSGDDGDNHYYGW